MRSLRTSTVALAMAAAVFSSPAESQAIFHWFQNCCNGGGLFAPSAAVPVAAPVYTAYGADPCGCQPQRVSYVPQTCYRTQYVNAPTTVYRPVTVADPCTGCPVTTLRPMIAYVPQARQVPYVSYRIVYTNPAGVAYPAATTVNYAVPAGCSGCGATAPAYTPTYAPAAQPYYPGAITTPGRSTSPTQSANGAAREQTFSDGANTGDEGEQRNMPIKPIPDSSIDKDSRRSPAKAPQLIAPDDSRTTSRGVQ
ncbi:MAG TPA: hypothetical protein VGX78_04395, partial [Pirellulales bacterium]|nr:hypothetical protein [Pirellulales bacterium]